MFLKLLSSLSDKSKLSFILKEKQTKLTRESTLIFQKIKAIFKSILKELKNTDLVRKVK